MNLSKPGIHQLVLQKVKAAGIEPSGKIAGVIADSIYDVLCSREFAAELESHIADVVRRMPAR